MSRQQPPAAETDSDHERRLHRAVSRSQIALSCSLAQSPSAPQLGMKVHVVFSRSAETGQFSPVALRHDEVDREQLEVAATRARIFTLKLDGLLGTDVVASIAHFAKHPDHISRCETLAGWWRHGRFNRATAITSQGGTELTSPGGVDSGTVADRVLYSELWHADDATEILNGIDPEFQLWSLAGLVGDWLALISYQEDLIASVRPDICPSPTRWGGDPTTILTRLDPQAGGATDAQPSAGSKVPHS